MSCGDFFPNNGACVDIEMDGNISISPDLYRRLSDLFFGKPTELSVDT
jgi:hypothetical protein